MLCGVCDYFGYYFGGEGVFGVGFEVYVFCVGVGGVGGVV